MALLHVQTVIQAWKPLPGAIIIIVYGGIKTPYNIMWTGIIQNTGSIVISHPWDWFPFLWQSCINLCTNLPSSVHRRRRGCRCGRFAALQLLHHRYRSCCSWCTWRALIGNKSCLLALWPGWNVGVAHKLKMAERLEDQEKKTGSDLEFGVPDV